MEFTSNKNDGIQKNNNLTTQWDVRGTTELANVRTSKSKTVQKPYYCILIEIDEVVYLFKSLR